MITEAQQQLLSMPFQAKEHKFYNGQCYLDKSAIRARLHEVDPGYQVTPTELVHILDTVIVMRGGLTLSGITRHALGTGIIINTRKLDNGEIIDITGFELSRAISKAFKSAASDLLPRSAVLFGCGDYLKDLPRAVKTPEALAPWLDGKFKEFHWAFNGGKQRVVDKMKELGLVWGDVALKIEPGRRLRRLSDTLLPVEDFLGGLEFIAKTKKAS